MRTRLWIIVLAASLLALGAPGLQAQGGHFEISGHYGRWTLDLLGNAAIDLVTSALMVSGKVMAVVAGYYMFT